MKKLLVLFLALVPGAAFAAGLDISWNACIDGPGAAASKTFVCTGTVNQNYVVEFQYKSPIDIANFVAISGPVDLMSPGAPTATSPFWHYENGGCNGSTIKGAQIIGTLNAVLCPSQLETWDGGPSGTFAIAAYVADYQGPGRGHMVLVGARGDGVPITADVNMWAWEIKFNNRMRTACLGCAEQKIVVWQNASLESNDGSPAVNLSGADKGSDCAQINGAPVGGCGVVPTQSTSWGKIKSLYR